MLGKSKALWLTALAGAATLVGAQSARAMVTIYSDAAAFAVAAGPIKAFSSDGSLSHGLGFSASAVVTPEALFRDSTANAGVLDFHFANGTNAFGGGFDRLPGVNFSNNLKVTLVFADGTRQVLDPLQYRQDGFFGVTSATAFTHLLIENIGGAGGGGGGGGGGGFGGGGAPTSVLGGGEGDLNPGTGPRLDNGGLDQVDNSENGGSGVTVVAVGAVPEPAGWTLMIGGFLGAGAMLRQRRRLARARA